MWLEESMFKLLHWNRDPDTQHKMDGQILPQFKTVQGKVHPKMKILCLPTQVRLNIIIHRTFLELESKTALKLTEVLKQFLNLKTNKKKT